MAGCKLTTRSLFFSLLIRSPSFWARKSDVSGADKLWSDCKVSATWVESRLGKIPICVYAEKIGRVKEREEDRAKDGSRIFFRLSYIWKYRALAFLTVARSRVSRLFRFVNTCMLLACFRRNLIRLQTYAF